MTTLAGSNSGKMGDVMSSRLDHRSESSFAGQDTWVSVVARGKMTLAPINGLHGELCYVRRQLFPAVVTLGWWAIWGRHGDSTTDYTEAMSKR